MKNLIVDCRIDLKIEITDEQAEICQTATEDQIREMVKAKMPEGPSILSIRDWEVVEPGQKSAKEQFLEMMKKEVPDASVVRL